jgi:tRNA pseudouridine55 synthase
MERLRAEKSRLKLCHGGTLDPFAEGLLLALVGPATKLFPLLHEVPKTYLATLRWGWETDNGDPTGAPVAPARPHGTAAGGPLTGNGVAPPGDAISAALDRFLGWTDQIPHPTSARRIDGERAYARVQRGEAVDLPPAPAYLHSAEIVASSPETTTLRLTCRGGFYVRALVRDLGRKLGVAAHLSALRREQIGPWRPNGSRVHGAALLPWLPSRALCDRERAVVGLGGAIPAGDVIEGAPLPENFPPPSQLIRGLHGGRLAALLRQEGDLLVPQIGLGRGC